MRDFSREIDSYFDSVKATLDAIDRTSLNRFVEELLALRERGGTVYVFGNGGSAATAVHFYSDLLKGVSYGLEKRFRIQCFNDNVSAITCIANDLSYADVFLEPLKNFARSGDMVVGISCSGNSPNVVKAVEYAKKQGLVTVGLGAYTGGKLEGLSDIFIHARVDSFEVSEDVHMVIIHLVKSLLMDALKGEYRDEAPT